MPLHVKTFICGLLAGGSLYGFVKWIFSKKSEKTLMITEKDKDECVFFSPQGRTMNCINNPSTVLCNLLSCPVCNYRKFLKHIKNTKTHLDICVYLITLEELSKAVIQLFSNGVFVRIITDKQMSDEATNSKIVAFSKNHIPIKVITTGEMMHNKFVIIDQKIVITGSFNWTRQGLTGNFENGVIIHNEEIVKKFSEYFQDMWLNPF